ncbi:MAG: apolipoprotein N-acyltransferase [Deltaproteobacteria bacterium]|nr:apolipoprotein N-acyltransferase [Deltaproteobacteria bacterium]
MLLTIVSLLLSGLIQATISPPLNWIAIHPVSWVPALWVFSRLRGRRALVAGWTVGTCANLAIFYWLPGTVTRFGGLPASVALVVWLLFAAATGFYTALFALGFGSVRRAAGTRWPLAAAAWFCALEFLNPQLFGYLQGVAWYQVPRIFLVSAITGVSGVSFLVILCNAVVLQGTEVFRSGEPAMRRAWLGNAAVLAALVLLAVGYSSARLDRIAAAESEADPLRIALIQPYHTIERRRAMEASQPDAFARDLLALSLEAEKHNAGNGKIDVFVWPEGALRVDPGQARNRAVLDFVGRSGAEVWTGANHNTADSRRRLVSHNSAFRIFGDGAIDERYDKNILVPFGEYVPLRDVIPGFDRLETVGNFEAGTSVPKYTSGAARFVFLICYEAIRSGFVREALSDDVNLIVNVTVDAWYGNASEQSQHLMLAATQSAMNGIPLLRSTTTGISAFVDARGVLTAQAGNFTREALVSEVRPVRVPGVYSHWGDWFAWLCVAASALLLIAAAQRRAPIDTSSQSVQNGPDARKARCS